MTGGAGFVGTPLVRLLEEVGADVRVIRSRDHDLLDADRSKNLHRALADLGGTRMNRRSAMVLDGERANAMMSEQQSR